MNYRTLPKQPGAWVRAFHRISIRRSLHCNGFHSTVPRKDAKARIDVDLLLNKPTWSVESLLPPADTPSDSPSISSKQLHHLLRLSALPPPKDADEEATMLKTLSSQLHFVKEIQKVDTTGVIPLRSLRDETKAGMKEQEIGLEDLKGALEQEEMRGTYYKRTRRRQDASVDTKGAEDWDVLGSAERKVGRYFVVETGKTTAVE